jgi:hypothetical protein
MARRDPAFVKLTAELTFRRKLVELEQQVRSINVAG